MKPRLISTLLALSSMFLLPLAAPQTTPQTLMSAPTTTTPLAATASTAVPALVPYSGEAIGRDGKPLAGETPIAFLIYKDEQGGEPVFIESQTVAVDASGRYKVQLGASLSSGLPADLFSSGAARWLEVQIAGQAPQPRILLVSVPYALKAADAATLGGLPASAFALAGTTPRGSGVNAAVTGANAPDAVANVTTTGGTSGYLPVFSGASTVVDSILFQSGTGIGIGDIPNSSAALDVNGKTIVRGVFNLSRSGDATAAAGFDSYPLFLQASAYNSATETISLPAFYLQAEPTGNNTANPGATFKLLYGSNGNPAETGFYFNPNGTINFAPGQTFPGTGAGTLTGVTAGTALTGGGSSGNVTLNLDTTKVPLLGSANVFVGNQSVTGNVTANDSSAATNASGIVGNESAATGLVYGVLGTAKSSTLDAAGVQGVETATTGQVYGVNGTSASSGTNSAGVGGYAMSKTGAVAGVNGYAISTTNGATGIGGYEGALTGTVYGASGGTGSKTNGAAGVFGEENAATGQVFGVSGTVYSSTTAGAAGVYGVENAPTGAVYGVSGITYSAGNLAAGVGGYEGSAKGQVYGVIGDAVSVTDNSVGVYGNEEATTGKVFGTFGGAFSTTTNAAGVFGLESATTGRVFGVEGTSVSTTNGAGGVAGYQSALSGVTYGVQGTANSTTDYAAGVNGNEGATTGIVFGVSGNTVSTTFGAAGVAGQDAATTGQVYGVSGSTGSSTNGAAGVVGQESATTGGVFGVYGGTQSPAGIGVSGNAYSATGNGVGVQGTSAGSGSGAVGVNGLASSSAGNTTGVQGVSLSPDGTGVLGTNTSGTGGNGVIGISITTGAISYGVQGIAGPGGYGVSGTSPNVGMIGLAESQCGPPYNCPLTTGTGGVFGAGTGGLVLSGLTGPTNGDMHQVFSVDSSGNGYFAGNLNVTGNLSKGGGSFKIDHPLDPANKYLSHSFVESPDMMDVYNGNITTDKRGVATVVLPEYFEALNRDFRYQLTVLGQFAQAIVLKKVDRNHFVIRTSKPGVEVSWQVTGIRQDAYANANRIPVEENKPATEQGYYLHPEAFGQPAGKSVAAAKPVGTNIAGTN